MNSDPKIVVKRLPVYQPLYDIPKGTHTIILIGGRGGGKTYEASKFLAYSCLIKKKRCVILRDEKALIRESILNEVLQRYDSVNNSGVFSEKYQKLETGIKDKETGEMVLFTKGFRASSSQKKANLKSISNVDISVIEEAEDITDERAFNTFSDSIRKDGSIVMLILNTPSVNHFIIKRYFNCVPVDGGFFEIEPKDISGLLVIKSSFKDNPYLPSHIIDKYNGYGDPSHYLYNPDYYYNSILGYATSGVRGQVYTNWTQIDDKLFPHESENIFWGIDVGWTNDPTAIVKVANIGNNIYLHECSYASGLTDNEISSILKSNGWDFEKGEKIYTDHDKDFSSILSKMRIPHLFAKKGAGSKMAGIHMMKQFKVHYTQSSVNLHNEVMNYCFEIKDGLCTNYPVDGNDHLLDAARMAVYTKFYRKGIV